MIGIHSLNRRSNIRDKSVRIIRFPQLLGLELLYLASSICLTSRNEHLLTSSQINRATFFSRPRLPLRYILSSCSPSDKSSSTLYLTLWVYTLIPLLESQ